MKYITNRKDWQPEAVEAAIAELAKRGKGLSEAEITNIRADIAPVDTRAEQKSPAASSFGNWKRNIVTDPEAPELYSQHAIWGFSCLMAPLFGAVLFSMNLYRLGKLTPIPSIIGGGIAWYIIAILLMPKPPTSTVSYLVNGIGGAILTYFIWPRLLGKELKYRRRPIWIPLIVALVVTVVILLVVLSDRGVR